MCVYARVLRDLFRFLPCLAIARRLASSLSSPSRTSSSSSSSRTSSISRSPSPSSASRTSSLSRESSPSSLSSSSRNPSPSNVYSLTSNVYSAISTPQNLPFEIFLQFFFSNPLVVSKSCRTFASQSGRKGHLLRQNALS